MTMFPVFHVDESGVAEVPRILGRITRTTHGQQPWVGDGWLGFLRADAEFISGRWHQRGDLWEFAPDDPDAHGTIRARSDWDVFDGYWGERAEFVLDRTLRWDK